MRKRLGFALALSLSACQSNPLNDLAHDPATACAIGVGVGATVIIARTNAPAGTVIEANATGCKVITGIAQ